MALTKVGGDVIQNPLNVGIITATRIDGNVSGDVNSTGVSTFTTLKVGTGVTISGGIVTATTFSGALTGNATGLSGTPNITVGSIIASNATISGNVSVAGTLTYEDVTNVDSIGIVTARSGVRIDAGGLVVVGVTTVAAGTTVAPSISPTGDTDTGIFFPAADTIAIGVGGSEVVRINSSGNVGIGITNPSAKLHVAGTVGLTTGASLAIFGTKPAFNNATSGAYGAVNFGDWNTLGTPTIISFSSRQSSGNLYTSNGGEITKLRFTATGTDGATGMVAGEIVASTTDSAYGNTTVSEADLLFKLSGSGGDRTTPVTRMVIKGSGNVGIGTTNPGATLNVVPTSTSIAGLFSGTTSSDMVRITQLGSGNALVVEDSANPDATPFVVNASGSVGIGTNNPGAKFEITGTTADQFAAILSNPNNRVRGDYQRGFGTAHPVAIIGNNDDTTDGEQGHLALCSGDLTPTSGGFCGLVEFMAPESGKSNPNSSLKAFTVGGLEGSGGSVGGLGGNIQFHTRGDNSSGLPLERVRITSSGNVGIGLTNPTSKLQVQGDASVSGIVTATTFSGQVNAGVGTITTLSGTNLNYSGIATIGTLGISGVTTTQHLNVTGVSTFTNGPILVGSSSSTGTSSQRLQVTGGAYVSESVGIGTTNPSAKLSIGSVSGFQDTTTTVATTSATTIDSFSATVFRSARVQVQITQSTNYQASDILIIHDGTTTDLIEYGSIATNDYLGSFSGTVSGGNCLLRISMNSATSATVKVLSQRITV